MRPCRVADIERALARAFPPERAEDWDHVGLIAGDPGATVTGVLVALDASIEVISEAVRLGANVLVTHHPAFLKPPRWITAGRGPAGVAFAALSQGVALISAHTNLDRDPAAQALLPALLGLSVLRPLERSLQPSALVTVYAPADARDTIVDAMSAAGAGHLGAYDRCSFTGEGNGQFTPSACSHPAVGTPGVEETAPEVRIEMVCPTASVRGVASAAAAAHPYEEPLITCAEVQIARNRARIGVVCESPERLTLAQLAERCASALLAPPRVFGDASAPVRRIAVTTGSGSSLVGDALAARADVLIAGEVRYHDALDAAASGLCVIDVGHDLSEWPMVGLLADAVASTPGLAADRIQTLTASAAWWTTTPLRSDR